MNSTTAALFSDMCHLRQQKSGFFAVLFSQDHLFRFSSMI